MRFRSVFISFFSRFSLFLMLAPAVLMGGGLFFGGFLLSFLQGLGINPFQQDFEPSLDAYLRAINEPGFLTSTFFTFYLALSATLLSTILGVGGALLVHGFMKRNKKGRTIAFLFQLNLAVPHAVAAVGFLLLLTQSGFLARLAYASGLIDAPHAFLELTADPYGFGIIIAYLWKEAPFIGGVALVQLSVLGDGPAMIARTLGATRLQILRYITLPMILPGTLIASLMVFAFILGAYEIPALLGSSHPKMLPVLAYEMFTGTALAGRPAAIALSLLLSFFCLGLLSFYWLFDVLRRRGYP